MALKIYPFISPGKIEKKEPDLAREYAFDFDTRQFKRKDGQMYIVEGNEALKIWIWKVFMTARYKHTIFPWSFGNELEKLIGKAYTQGYVNSEAKRYYTEALDRSLKEYIKSIEDLEVMFDDGTLIISAWIKTIYGNIKLENMKIWG